ncbi:hypothetical protein D3C71_1698260 [compost metagenome]
MVSSDEINHTFRQLMPARNLYAFMNMFDDDLSTLLIRQLIMRTQGCILVLYKILGILNFTNIMIQCTGPNQ